MESYGKLIDLVSGCADDLKKAVAGNVSAGTRVRKVMQEVKAAAQEVRKDVMALRNKKE